MRPKREPLSPALAKVAGEALAAIKGATPIDAIVMASAAQRGDVVYTADVSDLARLAGYFRAVRVLAIGRRAVPGREVGSAARAPLASHDKKCWLGRALCS
jgi:hypothetical protein